MSNKKMCFEVWGSNKILGNTSNEKDASQTWSKTMDSVTLRMDLIIKSCIL